MNSKVKLLIIVVAIVLVFIGCAEEKEKQIDEGKRNEINLKSTDVSKTAETPEPSEVVEVVETDDNNEGTVDMSTYYLEKARLGKLKLNMTLEEVEKIIGKPSSKGKEMQDDVGDGFYYSTYTYKDSRLELHFVRKEEKDKIYKLHQINTLENCKLKTEKGIRLGDSLSNFEDVYKGMFRISDFDFNARVVGGKTYADGGTNFFFKNNVLVEISIGHGHPN